MFEIEPQNTPRPGLQVLLGLLLGMGISLGCLAAAIFVGMALKVGGDWVFELLIAIALIGAGLIALRQVRESSVALGVMIALSIALLLDGACAVRIGAEQNSSEP